MRSGAFLICASSLLLFSCGRGGVTLDTTNVDGEWFPEGSQTTITLDHEATPVERRAPHTGNEPISIRYFSTGKKQGTLSINGASTETASVTHEQGSSGLTLQFETAGRTIHLTDCQFSSSDKKTASILNWHYTEKGVAPPRRGTGGTMTTTQTSQTT